MTLPAFDTKLIRGLEGPAYKVGPTCAAPSCRSWADGAHHIVRRSAIGGPFDWVDVDGIGVLANKTGLCFEHHNQVTDHRRAVRYDQGLFVWAVPLREGTEVVGYELLAPLFPQPPTPESLAERTPGTESESVDSCPFCGQSKRRRHAHSPSPPGRARRRKTWVVSVPEEAEEDGAEALDVLVDDLAPLLGYHASDDIEQRRLRYFVLVPTLYYAHQNRAEFIQSIKGVA